MPIFQAIKGQGQAACYIDKALDLPLAHSLLATSLSLRAIYSGQDGAPVTGCHGCSSGCVSALLLLLTLLCEGQFSPFGTTFPNPPVKYTSLLYSPLFAPSTKLFSGSLNQP